MYQENNKEPNYFLISVSNKRNLDLCLKYTMAGFTNSINGFWTFSEIDVGDYVSFLYGARVKNLYRVKEKKAFKNAENLPPWPPVTFKMSGNTYYFPFRLFLEQERELDEPMVRPEFSYVAENLLLRGGYRKTHFQADIVTFYNVSQMGKKLKYSFRDFNVSEETFIPRIVFQRDKQKVPETFYFQELILQSIIRRKIRDSVLKDILEYFGIEYSVDDFEILGEKALSEGFVDIFIKLKHPQGGNEFLLVEIKTQKAQKKDFLQLKGYLDEFGDEATGGVLIAKDFPKNIFAHFKSKILPLRYWFDGVDFSSEYTYKELTQLINFELGL